MNILITGAAGHIGSYLIRELDRKLKKKTKIFFLDNFLSNKYNSLFDLKKKIRFLNFDLAKCKINSIPKCEVVIHLAAKTDAAQSSKYKKEFYSNNLPATKKIISYCKANNSLLIFASSTSVYGPQSKWVDENCSKQDLKPQSPYAVIKLREEKLISKKLKKFLILRLGTIYGYSQGMRFHTAVNKFCFQSATNQPLSVWKSAYNQRRPYLSLNDLCRSIAFIINNRIKINTTYNILSNNYAVKDIVKCIKLIKKKTQIKKVSHEIMNQLSYNVSNSKFTSLGFDFKSDLYSDIKATLSKLKNLN